MFKKDFVVGLDIGTTKICCVVGELVEFQGSLPQLNIIGVGTAPSSGLRKGVVVNIEETVGSIAKAVEAAELMSHVDITTVYTGIAGGHIRSFNSTASVPLRGEDVSEQDIRRVIDAAKAVAIPLDRETIHIIPQEFRVDDHDGIRDPLGFKGSRLDAKVHIVTGAVSSAQNIIKCVNEAGLNVAEICLEPIASSEAVLSQDEKELGVVLVDIGGGTSDFAIFKDGVIVHTGVLAIGGNHISSDIAVGLRTPQHEAEKIKIRYGCALTSLVKADETIEVAGVGGRKPRVLPRKMLAEIIESRAEEIFSLIRREIMKSGFQDLFSAGVVITGGSTLLEGMPELAEVIFEMPVKRGFPLNICGLIEVVNSPKHATGVGLLRYGARNISKTRFPIREKNIYEKVRGSMRTWIKDLF
jgi:cell division protein FtsA